jgi:hypothetical protein
MVGEPCRTIKTPLKSEFYLNFEPSRDQFLKLSIVFGTALNREISFVLNKLTGQFKQSILINDDSFHDFIIRKFN